MTGDSKTRTPETDRHDDWVRCQGDRFWRDFGVLEKAGEIHKADPLWLVAALRVEAQQLENRVQAAAYDYMRLHDYYDHRWEDDRQSIDRLTMLAEVLGQVVKARRTEAQRHEADDVPPF